MRVAVHGEAQGGALVITLLRALLGRLHIGRAKLLLFIVVVPAAALLISGCASPASDHGSGGNGDSVGTQTGKCSDLPGTLNDPNSGAAIGLQPASSDGKTPSVCDPSSPAQKSEPVATALANHVGQNRIAINLVWTLVTGYLVMFMQAGFALVETGFTRAKSASHTMMMNFMVYGLGMLGYFIAGFAFQFGGLGTQGGATTLGGTAGLTPNGEFNFPGLSIGGHSFGIFGTNGFFLSGTTYDVGIAVLFLFQMVFMDTAATIPTGAMAERWKFSSFAIFGLFVSTLTYPIFGNWAWGGGWLFTLGQNYGMGNGYSDFAGSGVVHSVGGWMALAGAMVLGPRIGKYNRDGTPNTIPGHNFTLAVLGCFILAFGWFGFNPGSTLGASGVGDLRIGIIAVNTMIAGATASLAAMCYMWVRTGKPDGAMTANGLLAGLVAITAPSGFVSPLFALIIGAVAGTIVCISVWFFDWVAKVDDPVGAISVHGVCGAWGVFSVGLFADGNNWYGGWNGVAHGVKGIFFGDNGSQLEAQSIGIVTCLIYVWGLSWIFFKLCDKLFGIRTDPAAEIGGLDIPEIGHVAYPPDFEGPEPPEREVIPDQPTFRTPGPSPAPA
jgi:Amt family ammonium transporter